MDNPKSCCPQGSWPALTVNYQPKGTKFSLGDTTVYHVGDSNRVLVIISDIFGATSGRHESVADTYASFGYNVYLPQILETPYVQGSGSIMENIKNQNWQLMEKRFKALRQYLQSKGHNSFYSIGFCWGVWAGFKFASKFEGFKAFVGFHPSFPICGLFGQNEAQLISSVKCPSFFCPAENDPANVKQGGQYVTILQNKFGAQNAGSKSFPEQVHGWVVRGDITQPAVHRDVEIALRLSKQFFAKL